MNEDIISALAPTPAEEQPFVSTTAPPTGSASEPQVKKDVATEPDTITIHTTLPTLDCTTGSSHPSFCVKPDRAEPDGVDDTFPMPHCPHTTFHTANAMLNNAAVTTPVSVLASVSSLLLAKEVTDQKLPEKKIAVPARTKDVSDEGDPKQEDSQVILVPEACGSVQPALADVPPMPTSSRVQQSLAQRVAPRVVSSPTPPAPLLSLSTDNLVDEGRGALNIIMGIGTAHLDARARPALSPLCRTWPRAL